MGKSSLIKSTSKKKKTKKEAGETTDKKKTVKAKTTSKAKAANTTKKTPAKKITIKELIFKKFETYQPKELYIPPTDPERNGRYTAPPSVTGGDADVQRIKKLLFSKYDWESVKAAAEKAAAEKAAAEKAAAEKAAAEKAAAEKAAAEKAAAEKAAAEKAAAEKAAAEKAAAEKAAAEKAAAEKAAAEKAAAEKAAAEKAAAEKAAAEKAAAEKAAAEKAAAEKAAAEKAVAEKAAAEKAAAEKAAAEKIKPTPPLKRIEPEQKVSVSYIAGKKRKPMDPQTTTMKLALGLFTLLVLSALGVSFSNSNTYTLVEKNGAVEVWKGKFAPLGKNLLLILADVELPGEMKTNGSKKMIFPFVVNYYLEKADGFLDTPGTPNFIEINSYLDKAIHYAVTPEQKGNVNLRMVTIQLMSLLYRAEVKVSEATPEGRQQALALLEEAKTIAIDVPQAELLDKKIADLNMQLTPSDPEASDAAMATPVEKAMPSSH